ncbi:MAG: Ig-like domain-containing protein, partial [Cyclobacteriaceae bacterium]
MRLIFTLLLLAMVSHAYAVTGRYRLTLRDNPSSSIVIGWDQISGSGPVVYYGTADKGSNWSAYPLSKSPDRKASYRGMNNHFARLSNLQADTYYYFVIRDSDGTSQRFYFKTAPADASKKLSFIAGGDSRNNRTPRQNANRLVAKLKPTAVLFGGDMTDDDTNSQWITWFNDWQLTISSDGRMYPIVATRGNHEGSNSTIFNLFDTPSGNVYYALTFGGNLIRTYTLNTEMSISGSQTSWLSNDLQSVGTNVIWKTAQYHKPMRPHVSSKSEGNNQYNYWADLFYAHKVKLVVECDAHTVKTTWPVRPGSGSGFDEGFIRDDQNGTTYVGEGCWGAPLRSNNDNKNWTRNSGRFNQFKWIFVDQSKIEVRTIKVDNASAVGEVSNANPFNIPANLDIWNPSNGNVVTIKNSTPPTVSLTAPAANAYFEIPQNTILSANASDADGNIDKVEFIVNGAVVASDSSSPYSVSYNIPTDGIYRVLAKAYDNEGNTTSSSFRTITVGQVTESIYKRISSGADDVEESANGNIYTNSSDLELVADGSKGNQIVGLRFTGLSIPKGATIDRAYIQFTTDEKNSGNTNLMIRGHDTDNASAFSTSKNNVSGRTRTSSSVNWSSTPWTSIGQSGSNQRTPEIKNIVQEIVDRSGWSSGNSMAVIISGSGERTAEAYEGSSNTAPLLHVAYSIGGNSSSNTLPAVSLISPVNGQNFGYLNTITLSASASDEDGNISEVEFFVDGVSIGKDSSVPYSKNWTPKSEGVYAIYVKTQDNAGAISSTEPITVNVSVETPNCYNSYPSAETFEGDLSWKNTNGDDLNWTVISGKTPSNGTGPSAAVQGLNYIYVEASSPNYPSKNAYLESGCFDLSPVSSPLISFSYHMFGNAMGSLSLQVKQNESIWITIWSQAANQGSSWKNASVDLSDYSASDNLKFRFEATTGSGWQSDICLDDIQVKQGNGSTSTSLTFTKRISSGNDDVEENQSGKMYMNSTDLELVYDGAGRGNQKIGMRFQNITIPKGATIE